MTKDSKINIKIEVSRDQSSGELTITAHFNTNAPNIMINNNEYLWIPTDEEKDLLFEAFDLLPLTKTIKPTEKIITKPSLIKEEPVYEPEIKEKTPPHILDEKKQNDEPIFEKPKELNVFETTHGKIDSNEFTREEPKIEDNNMKVKVDVKTEEKKEDRGIIVESDEEAIEAALKRYRTKEEDRSIREVDEQTIIDRVLSQKKKGKWKR